MCIFSIWAFRGSLLGPQGSLFFIKIDGKYVYFEHTEPSEDPRKCEKMTLRFLGGLRGALGASMGVDRGALGPLWGALGALWRSFGVL